MEPGEGEAWRGGETSEGYNAIIFSHRNSHFLQELISVIWRFVCNSRRSPGCTWRLAILLTFPSFEASPSIFFQNLLEIISNTWIISTPLTNYLSLLRGNLLYFPDRKKTALRFLQSYLSLYADFKTEGGLFGEGKKPDNWFRVRLSG